MSMYRERLARLRGALDRLGADAALISQPESRRYLSGYSGHDMPPRDSAGYLFVSARDAFLLTDGRTAEMAAAESPDYEVVVYQNVELAARTVAELSRKSAARRVAFESIHLPYVLWQRMGAALAGSADLVEGGELVDQLRIAKDAEELRQLGAAVAVLDDCFGHLVEHVLRAGITERQVSAAVDDYLRSRGSETSFASIVASGPNSAIPHAPITDRELREGEPLKIDIGAVVNGYCSDMTRTVCLGEAPPQLRELHALVLESQETAERDIRPGMTGREGDTIAREVIQRAGHADLFTHGTGHGIGLEVHEPPWLSQSRGDHVLAPGMVFSVEPGVYLPGWGGVRIEDLVVLEANGARVLSQSPKTLELRGDRP
jgi:Xaa-Pro aminopeptidase